MVELDGPKGEGSGGDKWPRAEKVRRKFESLDTGRKRAPDALNLCLRLDCHNFRFLVTFRGAIYPETSFKKKS